MVDYQIVKLADGRSLGILNSGPADAKPIFFFAGFGVSARASHPNDSLSSQAGVRLISVDRPGLGASSPHTNRKLLDWPADIDELADRIGVQKFGVFGWSAGGPHALACAYQMPARVCATGIFSCAPPFANKQAIACMPAQARHLALVARCAPALLKIGFRGHCLQIRRDADALLVRSIARLCDADRTIINDPEYRDTLKSSMIQACAHGPRGLLDDVRAIARPWGFGLAQLQVPVHLWHGELDTTIPVEVGHFLAKTIGNCHATYLAGAGHFSYLTNWSSILNKLGEAKF